MNRIQIYTTRWCGYCVRAKALLDAKGIAYEEVSLDDDPAFRRNLFDLTGGWTVPQILLDGTPIGGFTELWRLDKCGRSTSASRVERRGAGFPAPRVLRRGTSYRVPENSARRSIRNPFPSVAGAATPAVRKSTESTVRVGLPSQ